MTPVNSDVPETIVGEIISEFQEKHPNVSPISKLTDEEFEELKELNGSFEC